MSFEFEPAQFVPFRDTESIKRVCAIAKKDLCRHPNSEFRISIHPTAEIEFMWFMDMFQRIKWSMDAGEKLVMILPQPYRGYRKLAGLINQFGIDCRNLYTFNMDEYADQHGNIAPYDWEYGFGYSLRENLYYQIDPKLRPPEDQMIGFTNENINDYGERIADLGGADICYSGPGWTGHLAFIEPDASEFVGTGENPVSLEKWKQMGPRICTLSPFTIAQNSLHGSFGASGNLCAVPPKAATIGPAEVIGAKNRIDMHAITVGGSFMSWQRLVSRLVLHGPVTPLIPESILQTLPTTVWVSEEVAADIRPYWEKGY